MSYSRTTVTTHIGSGGTRTETRTYTSGGRGGVNVNMDKNGLSASVNVPTETSRYSQGWGSVRESRPPAKPGLALTGKSYEDVKAECLKSGALYEDPDFPATDVSVFYSRKPPRSFEWKRPTEITSNPKMFVGGASRFDINQGELGDCWLLAATASLCQFPDLLARVVPMDQDFDKDYCGAFCFHFWQYGKWVEIIVDDRLPTYNNRLVFMHSKEMNEFWTALMEKAYAKLFGSYEALKGGSSSEAMEDFTGGITEVYDLRQNLPSNFYDIMAKSLKRKSLMGCSIDAVPGQTEAELPNGLIAGHAYSITDVRTIEVQTARVKGKLQMVRVRNPWGNECEWKGAWSDKSQEWRLIGEEQRQEMGLTFSNDGEFWMSYQDFISNWHKVEICNLGPVESASNEETARRWEASVLNGCWKPRVSAGGCRNYIDTFWTNPQYVVEVTDADEDDNENLGTLIVGLMQKERRKKRKEGVDLLTMGYAVYKLSPDDKVPLDLKYFKGHASAARSPSFINLREVAGRHRLPPGKYCIVPSTFEPNQEGDFLVRLFSEQKNNTTEADEETGIDLDKKAPPPTVTDERAEKELKEAFKKVSGEDLEIDAYELQGILNAAFQKDGEFQFDGFSADTCRGLVAMMDLDRSGKLGYEEFKKLWTDLRHWKAVFKQFDKDNSSCFNSYETREAFRSIGYTLSNATFNALVMRYSHRDGKMYFDDFIHCVARMKTMFEIFNEMKKGGGNAEFTVDQFIQTTMYS